MNILYLYSELMGYQIPVLEEYVKKYGAKVHVFHFDNRKLTPYKPPNIANVTYYNRSNYSTKALIDLVKQINPTITYISGWMDFGYLRAVRVLRKNKLPVVVGSDGIFFNTIKQNFATLLFPLFKNKFYSHYWVPGPYQYEFAKRLGFKSNEIIFNCYSADIELFNRAYDNYQNKKKENYPHRFLFVGRIEESKGIDLLVAAWNKICFRQENKDWDMLIVGNGSLSYLLENNKNIIFKSFLMPEDLICEIESAGCFVIPSRYEPWALVIHEFSAAGLPVICTNVCGAAPVFVTSGYNGYVMNSNDIQDLEKKMLAIINSSDDQLVLMGERSHNLGQKINPAITAASFISVLKDQ